MISEYKIIIDDERSPPKSPATDLCKKSMFTSPLTGDLGGTGFTGRVNPFQPFAQTQLHQ